MKKIYSTLLMGMAALLSAGSAAAAITDTGKVLPERPRFMPKKFTKSNETQFVTHNDDNEDGSYTFTIYDSSFGKLTEFTTPSYPEVTATTTIQEALRGPIGVSVENTNEWEMYDMTETEFKDMCAENGFTKTEQHGSETWYLSSNEWEYYYYEIYTTKYPQRYYIWKNGKGYEASVNYKYEDWGPTGLYGEAHENTKSDRPGPEGMDPRSEESTDMDYIYITQTLFNSDDQYEWIIGKLEAVDCSYQNPEMIVSGKEVRCTGFKVMSQDGSTVADVTYPAGYFCSYIEPYLYMVGDQNYLVLDVRDENNYYYYLVYSISSTTGRMELVGEPMKVSVSPTAPRRGTPVTVSLGQNTSSCQVSVISTDGRTVMTRNIQPGVNTIDIATDNLHSGMYIVNVTDGKTTREATKIIIR